MVKPYMSIKLKDPQHYYLEDETIACIIDLRLEKVLKDPLIKISFKGRSSSHSNGSRNHYQIIFTSEKEISIAKWNNPESLKKIKEVEFTVEVPNGMVIPSFKNLEGSDGGKVEYMIVASLESASFLKRSIQATHIIQVPLIGKVNVGEEELQKPRESSIRWPKNEESANAFVLSAWIPRGGCVRGKDVPIRVELKQPDRYQPPKVILVELVQQEMIASSRDSLPDMTKQLEDKVVQKDEKDITLMPEMSGSRLLSSSQVLVFTTPSNITPTISKNAKVMRLDYKLRVTVRVPEADSGRDRGLSINLPIVIGTTGVSAIYDSGFDLSNSIPYGSQHAGGSEGNNSVSNGYGGGFPVSSYPPISPTALQNGIGNMGYQPYPGGFHMPDPKYIYPPMYPPNRFLLNPQQLEYNSSPDQDEGSNKFEKMPVPDFGHSNNSPFLTFIGNGTPPNDFNRQSLYPPPAQDTSTAAMESAFDMVFATQAMMSPQQQTDDDKTVTTNALSPTSSTNTHKDALVAPLRKLSLNKPNTPTPPQTPAVYQVKARQILRPNESSSSSYYSSSLLMESTISDGSDFDGPASPTSNDKTSIPLRVDPLLRN